MQSLKSTAVAVMLLALSFGMYQMSDTPQHDPDQNLIPAIDIAEGLEPLQIAGSTSADADTSVVGNTSLTPKPLALPELKQPPSKPRLASKARTIGAEAPSNYPLDQSSEPSFSANQFVSATADPKKELPRVPVPDQNQSQSFEYPAVDGGSSQLDASQNFAASNSQPKAADRQLLDATADNALERDRGLMAALESQLNSPAEPASPVNIEKPVAQAAPIQPTVVDNKSQPNQFASTAPPSTAQMISSGDSSSNQFASSNVNDFSSAANPSANVFQAGSEPDLSKIAITAAWPTVDKLVAEERYRDALQLLTRFYNSGDVIGPQRQKLLSWLDALAGKVIFSSEHHFRPQPYTVGANESLADIAGRWKVPGQLIYNVNQKMIANPAKVAAGTQLKIIDASFDAEIGLRSHVMTLFVDGLYAGRYPIRTGISGDPRPGEYQVVAKVAEGFRWRDANGTDYPPGSPENGYGPHWIGLTGSLCMHAVKDDATDGHHGCIGLSSSDAADVFNILSEASTVTIYE